MLSVNSNLSPKNNEDSDLITTIMESKNDDSPETPTEPDQSPELERNKQEDATGPNPLTEENEKLKQEIEKLKQENEMLKQEKGRTKEPKPDSQHVIIPLTKRRGRMSKEDRMKFTVHMQFLSEELHPKDLIDTMFSKFLINEDEEETLRNILENQGRKRCAEKMLIMLLRCGKYAYTIFLKCLELTGYGNVIKRLEPNCEIFEGNIKYPGQQYHELITNDHPERESFIRKVEEGLEKIYNSTELVVITKLTKGCVQVTFHLISLGSKSESKLREVLESKVKSGYIGENEVSTEGFSFKKIESGNGEEIGTDRDGVQDLQQVTQENFSKLKEKVDELQGFNSRLLQHIVDLETELDEAEIDYKGDAELDDCKIPESLKGDVVDLHPDKPGYDKTDARGYSSRPSASKATPAHGKPMMMADDFDIEKYNMNHLKRGKAIIINNRRFDNMDEQTGTDIDVESLKQLFQKLGFWVKFFKDLPSAKMRSVLTEAASEDYGDSDCFMCAILSHGEGGKILGTDGRPIEIEELLAPFKDDKCRSLAGKPKIFFIEGGSGMKSYDGGVSIRPYDGAIKSDIRVDFSDEKTQIIPTDVDFLIANSAGPGYLSWTDAKNGSLFVQALCQVIRKYASKLDLMSMMTKLNKRLADEFEPKSSQELLHKKKQMPCIVSMLTKNVYFTPKSC